MFSPVSFLHSLFKLDFKKNRMHLPPHVVSAKMSQAGLSKAEITAFLEDKPLKTEPAAPAKSFRLDPKCAPFVKMLSLHMPPHVVKGKMKMKGFSAAEIEAFLNDAPLAPSSKKGGKKTGGKKGGKKKKKKIVDPFKLKGKAKFKAFFWSKMDPKKVEISKTMFKDLHAEKVFSKMSPDMLNLIKSKFAKEKSEGKKKDKGSKEKKDEKPKENKAGIITGDRNRNVGIAISRIKVKYNDFAKAIMMCDETILTKSLVALLLDSDLYPSPDEAAALSSYVITISW